MYNVLNINGQFFFQAAYLLKSVDSRVSLIMFYGHKPKNEEREKALTYEFVSLLQCHRIFFDK